MIDMLEKIKEINTKIKQAGKLLQIEDLQKHMDKLAGEMNEPGFWDNKDRAQAVSQDYQEIKQEIEDWENLLKKSNDLLDLAKTNDQSLAKELEEQIDKLEKEYLHYEFLLLLDGPHDKNNVILSIHAGTGGTEAQDWAEMLLRMITRFCTSQGWKTKILSESRGQEAGCKSVMLSIQGRYAYGYLKSEHGVHRLVRISPFDAEKMRHTSFALIEVLPELDEKIEIDIDSKDLRIDTYMASGHGGQSVNTTYSAVRIVHEPTKITVTCQNERSQLQNKETALKILKAKLHKLEQEKKSKTKQELRGEYKSAEWGNQIRSYVLHPYHMVKDLRSGYESSDPESVLEGKLMDLSESYLRWLKEKYANHGR